MNLSYVDLFAIVWFFLIWIGYAYYAEMKGKKGKKSLMGISRLNREDWWRAMLSRELRIVDITVITNLSNSAIFFASTTLLILGGLLAIIGTSENIIAVMNDMPFVANEEKALWEFKLFLIFGIFVYAFFKFTWSLRQHNFCSVLVGAVPTSEDDEQKRNNFVKRAARISGSAADSFNYGLRAYYFALAALSWFLNSWIFITTVAIVVYILYRREFHSSVVDDMAGF